MSKQVGNTIIRHPSRTFEKVYQDFKKIADAALDGGNSFETPKELQGDPDLHKKVMDRYQQELDEEGEKMTKDGYVRIGNDWRKVNSFENVYSRGVEPTEIGCHTVGEPTSQLTLSAKIIEGGE